MSRNLKSLGLALVALLALTAVVASSASAKNVTSTSGEPTTYVTAESDESINQLDLANGANVKCTTTTYEGFFEGKSTNDLSLKATYSGCQSSGQTTTIDASKCTVTLTTATEIEPKNGDHFDGPADLTCSGGSIVVSVGDPTVTCTVTVHAQALKGTLDYTNITGGAKKDITITSTLEVAYTASGSVCGTANTGKLTGKLTAKGFSNATHTNQVDLWID